MTNPAPPDRRKKPRLIDRLAAWSLWIGCLITLILFGIMKLTGDRWWFGTVLLFGPRWTYIIPWLFGAAGIFSVGWKSRTMYAIVGLIGLFGIVGFILPVSTVWTPKRATVRVITCNMGGDNPDHAGRVFELIATEQPDVLVLQECRRDSVEKEFPDDWHYVRRGDLVIASPYAVTDAQFVHRDLSDRWPRAIVLMATIQLPVGPTRVGTLHLMSPSVGLQTILDRDRVIARERAPALSESIERRDWESRHAAEDVDAMGGVEILAGDFNMPTDSYLYRRDWSGYCNAYSYAGLGFGKTCRQTVRGIPLWARIDHILMVDDLQCTKSYIAKDIGSDHLPLVADIILK